MRVGIDLSTFLSTHTGGYELDVLLFTDRGTPPGKFSVPSTVVSHDLAASNNPPDVSAPVQKADAVRKAYSSDSIAAEYLSQLSCLAEAHAGKQGTSRERCKVLVDWSFLEPYEWTQGKILSSFSIFTATLLKEFSKRGAAKDFLLVVPRGGQPLIEELFPEYAVLGVDFPPHDAFPLPNELTGVLQENWLCWMPLFVPDKCFFEPLPRVATVHDLMLVEKSKTSREGAALRERFALDIHRSEVLAPVSSFTAEQLKEEFGVLDGRMSVIPNPISVGEGCDVDALEQDIQAFVRNGYILNINGFGRHKNTLTLLKAFRRIKDQTDQNLICIGAWAEPDYFKELETYIEKSDMIGRVIMKTGVAEDVRDTLLRRARLFVTPSTKEGFGRSPVEAASVGVSVISSRADSLPEVTGNMVHYYDDPNDDEALAELMLQVLNKPDSKEELCTISEKLNKMYSAEICADKYMELFGQNQPQPKPAEEASVGIIVPIYNAEENLAECLDSLLAQTYQNLVVYAINDGSTDASEEILRRYAQKDERIVWTSTENRGPSAARNTGLELCECSLVTFVDADDYIEVDFIQKLVEHLDGADLSMACRTRFFEKDGGEETIPCPDYRGGVRGIEGTGYASLYAPLLGGIGWKLYRTSILKRCCLRFREDMAYGEDTVFAFSYLKEARSVSFFDYSGYRYRVRAAGSLSQLPKEAYIKSLYRLVGELKSLWSHLPDSALIDYYKCQLADNFMLYGQELLYSDLPMAEKHRLFFRLAEEVHFSELDEKIVGRFTLMKKMALAAREHNEKLLDELTPSPQREPGNTLYLAWADVHEDETSSGGLAVAARNRACVKRASQGGVFTVYIRYRTSPDDEKLDQVLTPDGTPLLLEGFPIYTETGEQGGDSYWITLGGRSNDKESLYSTGHIFTTDEIVCWLLALADEKEITSVFFDNSLYGPAVQAFKERGIQTVVYMHNVESVYEFQMQKAMNYNGSSAEAEEARQRAEAVRRCEELSVLYGDVLISINERDRKLTKQMYGRLPEYVIPVTFDDTEAAKRLEESGQSARLRPPSEPTELLFVGYNFPANAQGVLWFVKNVLPYVPARLTVVGRGMSQLSQQLYAAIEGKCDKSRLTVRDYVKDLGACYEAADAVVIPIFSGSGMKVKTAEAMMYGKVIFSTPEGLEGYNVCVDDIHRCEDAGDFIRSIVLNGLAGAKSYSPQVRKQFLNNYTTSAFEAVFAEILQ